MSNRIRIARGSKANKPSDLMYGEFYWEKVAAGTSEGVLYMGTPDGSSASAIAVGGARSMKSWYYKGVWSTASSFPIDPVMGDMYLMGVEGSGALAAFKTGDMMIFDGTSSWLRINNVGGDANETSYSNVVSNLTATNVQDAIDEVALKRFQYGGTFSAASEAYPASPKPGQFYITSDAGVVDSTTFQKGDAAFYNGTVWSLIPFSQAFPADGVKGTGTSNKLAKFDSAHGIADSNISDSGSEVAIGVNTRVTGSVQADSLKVGDGVAEQATITVPEGIGNIAISLPSSAGTLMRTADNLPSSQATYVNTGTALVATDVQAAITEIAKGKMAYAGTIAVAPGGATNYPASPVIGGLYLLTDDMILGVDAGETSYVKGDWTFYDGADWFRIPAGYTDAINTSFDNAGVTLGDGTTAVTETNVQTALAKLFTKKADLDANGLVPESQLPASIVGAITYKGSWDASTAYPANPIQGQYYIVSAPGNTGGGDYEIGDWIIYSGTEWQKIDNSDKISGIVVGVDTLVGAPEFQATGPLEIAAAGGIITYSVANATKNAVGVVQVGDGLAVDANGLLDIDATNGLHIGATGKLETYLNDKGLEIDANQMLGIKANSEFAFGPVYEDKGTWDASTDAYPTPAENGDYYTVTVGGTITADGITYAVGDGLLRGSSAWSKIVGGYSDPSGSLTLANTTVVAGTYPKVTVDAKGRVTGGASLLVSDVPVYVSGEAGSTEFYNATNGKVAGLKVVGPVGISKTGDAVTLDFTQTDAVTLASKFGVTAPADFDWSTRATGSAAITSIVGAVNANREDLDEYVSLLRTTGTDAGSKLIGTTGITGVQPTGESVGAAATLQAMLEGLKAYTDTAISNFDATGVVEVGTTGTAGRVAIFTGTDKIGDSNIGDTGSAVSIDVPLSVTGDLTIKKVDTVSSKLKMEVGGGSYSTTVVATAAGNNLALSLPSATGVSSGTILADFSIIDCGDYDA